MIQIKLQNSNAFQKIFVDASFQHMQVTSKHEKPKNTNSYQDIKQRNVPTCMLNEKGT